MIPTGAQLRAARAILGMRQDALAKSAGVSAETVKRLEGIAGPVSASARTVDLIVSALEAAGVLFIPENGEGAGVRLRKA